MKLVLPGLTVALGLELAVGAKMIVRPRPMAAAVPNVAPVQGEPGGRGDWTMPAAEQRAAPAPEDGCVARGGYACVHGRIEVPVAVLAAWRGRVSGEGDEPAVLNFETIELEAVRMDEHDGPAERGEEEEGEEEPVETDDEEEGTMSVSADGTFRGQLKAGKRPVVSVCRGIGAEGIMAACRGTPERKPGTRAPAALNRC